VLILREFVGKESSAPLLQVRPDFLQRTEFCASANVDGDFGLESVTIVGGSSYVFDMVEEFFQSFPFIAENDQTISGVAARAPEPVGLVSAQSRRQTVAAAKEIVEIPRNLDTIGESGSRRANGSDSNNHALGAQGRRL